MRVRARTLAAVVMLAGVLALAGILFTNNVRTPLEVKTSEPAGVSSTTMSSSQSPSTSLTSNEGLSDLSARPLQCGETLTLRGYTTVENADTQRRPQTYWLNPAMGSPVRVQVGPSEQLPGHHVGLSVTGEVECTRVYSRAPESSRQSFHESFSQLFREISRREVR
jgi:hypothetical protein